MKWRWILSYSEKAFAYKLKNDVLKRKENYFEYKKAVNHK